jgi:hypothetical protein
MPLLGERRTPEVPRKPKGRTSENAVKRKSNFGEHVF